MHKYDTGYRLKTVPISKKKLTRTRPAEEAEVTGTTGAMVESRTTMRESLGLAIIHISNHFKQPNENL